LGEARRTVMNLRSAALENNNLADALAETARQTIADTAVELEFETIGSVTALPATVEDHLLRIGQEAITNALKHSCAKKVRIELEYKPSGVSLRIQDDGRGFDIQTALTRNGRHFGLLGIHERAKQMEANLNVRSSPGQGTEVCLEVPIL
jgi:signal transduction histidine kinase